MWESPFEDAALIALSFLPLLFPDPVLGGLPVQVFAPSQFSTIHARHSLRTPYPVLQACSFSWWLSPGMMQGGGSIHTRILQLLRDDWEMNVRWMFDFYCTTMMVHGKVMRRGFDGTMTGIWLDGWGIMGIWKHLRHLIKQMFLPPYYFLSYLSSIILNDTKDLKHVNQLFVGTRWIIQQVSFSYWIISVLDFFVQKNLGNKAWYSTYML